MNVVLMGPPGAGKGTQAEKLATEFLVPRITAGDILRDAVKDDRPLGKKVRQYVEGGSLVPDDTILAVMGERMGKRDANRGWFLDGFPRTLEQAKGFDTWLQKRGQKIDRVFEIWVDAKVVVKRLLSRRQCSQCGATYNLETQLPKKNGICDQCGGNLILRKDDNEKTILHRLDVYEKQTRPLVKYFKNQGCLETVDGNQSPVKVFETLCSLIKSV